MNAAPRPRGPRRSPQRWPSLRYRCSASSVAQRTGRPTSRRETGSLLIGESRPSTPGTRTATPSCPTSPGCPTTAGGTPLPAALPTESAIRKHSHGQYGEGDRTTSAPARCHTTSCRPSRRGARRRSAAHGRVDECERTRSYESRAVRPDADRHERPPRGRWRTGYDTRGSRTTMARMSVLLLEWRTQRTRRGCLNRTPRVDDYCMESGYKDIAEAPTTAPSATTSAGQEQADMQAACTTTISSAAGSASQLL